MSTNNYIRIPVREQEEPLLSKTIQEADMPLNVGAKSGKAARILKGTFKALAVIVIAFLAATGLYALAQPHKMIMFRKEGGGVMSHMACRSSERLAPHHHLHEDGMPPHRHKDDLFGHGPPIRGPPHQRLAPGIPHQPPRLLSCTLIEPGLWQNLTLPLKRHDESVFLHPTLSGSTVKITWDGTANAPAPHSRPRKPSGPKRQVKDLLKPSTSSKLSKRDLEIIEIEVENMGGFKEFQDMIDSMDDSIDAILGDILKKHDTEALIEVRSPEPESLSEFVTELGNLRLCTLRFDHPEDGGVGYGVFPKSVIPPAILEEGGGLGESHLPAPPHSCHGPPEANIGRIMEKFESVIHLPKGYPRGLTTVGPLPFLR